MRSRIAAGLALLAVVAACSGDADPASSWQYGPIFSPPPASPGSSPAGTQGSSPAAPTAGSTPAGDATQVTIGTDAGSGLVFDPETAAIEGGGSVQVTFENRSIVPHNLTFQAPIEAATATVVDPGASETLEFAAPEPGEYPFVCTLHPGMDGTLTIEGP